MSEKKISVRGKGFPGSFELKITAPDTIEESFTICGKVKDDVDRQITDISREGLIYLFGRCLRGLKGELSEDEFWSNDETNK